MWKIFTLILKGMKKKIKNDSVEEKANEKFLFFFKGKNFHIFFFFLLANRWNFFVAFGKFCIKI